MTDNPTEQNGFLSDMLRRARRYSKTSKLPPDKLAEKEVSGKDFKIGGTDPDLLEKQLELAKEHNPQSSPSTEK